jgi:serralysin
MSQYLQTLVVLCFNIAIVDLSAYSNAGGHRNGGPTMLHERWATAQGSFWDKQQWLAGDFNGDGKDDLAKVFEEGGKASIEVHLAGHGEFNPQRWATAQGSFWDKQQWRVGDFNGDGKDDLAKVFEEGGKACIEVHLAGHGEFNPQRWATNQGNFWDEQQWRVGDFNGDGKDDLAKAFEEGGKACIEVHLASNGEFNPQRWATAQGSFWDKQQWLAGDFNGDGKDDLGKVFEERGKACIDVHLASNGEFNVQRWATAQGSFWDEQQWRAGDFNGDGKDDLAKAFDEGGKACIEVHLASNGEFNPQRWATSQGGFWNEQQWLAGDFNGDDKDDMAKAFEERGKANIDVHLSTH